MLYNKSKFYYKTLPPPNPQIKFWEECAMCIQQHHPILSSPTLSLRIIKMTMHTHSKCMRWWHYCPFTEGNQGSEELACLYSLPPASSATPLSDLNSLAAQPPLHVPIAPASSKVNLPPDSLWQSNGTLYEKDLCAR